MNEIVNKIMAGIGRITVIIIVFLLDVLIYVKASEFWAGVFMVFIIFLVAFLLLTDEKENL